MNADQYDLTIEYLGGLENSTPVYLATISAFGNLAQVHDFSRESVTSAANAAIELLITAYQDQDLTLPDSQN